MIYESRVLDMVDARLIAELQSVHESLGSGVHLNRADASASGMAFAMQIGRIAGIKAARGIIEQVEQELSGRKEPSKEPA